MSNFTLSQELHEEFFYYRKPKKYVKNVSINRLPLRKVEKVKQFSRYKLPKKKSQKTNFCQKTHNFQGGGNLFREALENRKTYLHPKFELKIRNNKAYRVQFPCYSKNLIDSLVVGRSTSYQLRPSARLSLRSVRPRLFCGACAPVFAPVQIIGQAPPLLFFISIFLLLLAAAAVFCCCCCHKIFLFHIYFIYNIYTYIHFTCVYIFLFPHSVYIYMFVYTSWSYTFSSFVLLFS